MNAPQPDRKRLMRAKAVETRRQANLLLGVPAAEALRDRLIASWPRAAGRIVAGFWPIGDEIDIRPLMRALADRGHNLVLPSVEARDQPLEFRRWQPGDPLEDGPHGTRHPLAAAEMSRPDIVLVPLLAFDRAGYRLGYGGGYYDRSLALLRRSGPVLTIGIGFAAQEVARVEREAHDERLDWIATEAEVIRLCRPESESDSE